MQIDDQALKQRLQAVDVQAQGVPEGLLPAAVLIGLHRDQDRDWVLLTKRTEHLRQHKGQISFPGGKSDPEDLSLAQTALRESWEEVGIEPVDVTLLGSMQPFDTISSYYLYAFVGRFNWPYDLRINPEEISELIRIPLDHLLESQHYRLEDMTYQGVTRQIHYYDYQQYTVWGITGFILNQFLELLQ